MSMPTLLLYKGCPETFSVTEQVSVTAQALAQSARAHERLVVDMWNLYMADDVREYHILARLESIRADAQIFQLMGHSEAEFPTYKGA